MNSTRNLILSASRKLERRTIARLLAFKSTGFEEEIVELKAEAGAISRSLYRTCLRSIRLIREGNEQDHKEFDRREEERMNKFEELSGAMSMLPPVDREDELRSRAEYYMQYLRENFSSESDSLDYEWNEQRIQRFLHHLRRGEDHRKWLVKDMDFDDEYNGSFDKDRVNRFEQRALELANRIYPSSTHGSDEEFEDPFSDSEDEEEGGLPDWYRNPRS